MKEVGPSLTRRVGMITDGRYGEAVKATGNPSMIDESCHDTRGLQQMPVRRHRPPPQPQPFSPKP